MKKYVILIAVLIIISVIYSRSSVCDLLRNVHSFQIERTCGSSYKLDPANDSRNYSSQNIHPLLFSDEEAFTKAINTAHPFVNWIPASAGMTLRGGIIPHHLVASDNIANFFSTMKQFNNRTIILIGPNHYEKGDFDVLTSRIGWDSPYGVVQPDKAIIDDLISKNLAYIDEETVEHDHSVASFAPFIQTFIPGTKVVPIILKRGFSIADAEKLSTFLSELPSLCHPGEATTSIGSHYNNCSDIFFLASVDFSHYLPKEIAFQKDVLTEKLLITRSYEELNRLNNDYLDSPPSIIVLEKTMEKIKANNIEIFAHTNSANYPNSDQKNTTSHFVVGFY